MSLRKLVCTAAVAAFLVTVTPPAGAVEQSQPEEIDALPFLPAPATQVWATRSLSAQPGQQQQQFLRLDIAQLTPRFVTGDSPGTVKITGKIVNVGDRKVHDIVLRLERGESLNTEDDLRKALREPAAAEFVQPKFTEIADELDAGQQKDFTLEVPLRGTSATALAIEEPGIYPILANINGRPDYGGQARLAALSTLLPVLGVPGGETKGKPGAPAKLTVLWPIADRPRLVRARRSTRHSARARRCHFSSSGTARVCPWTSNAAHRVGSMLVGPYRRSRPVPSSLAKLTPAVRRNRARPTASRQSTAGSRRSGIRQTYSVTPDAVTPPRPVCRR